MNTNLISFVNMQILCNTDLFKSMSIDLIFYELYFRGLKQQWKLRSKGQCKSSDFRPNAVNLN